ncbi:hypothetical protein G6O67_006734 [Ophiocordyceps sinensis]|uniref:Uncharacterized protein n=1 Tax=Ophiocordyceps sinensis TaxID=72228 RepID=A0A8H4LWU2_9HYPO|nr:hypothetical protein G6O67_006734 [Ophiocordyceps sinensis]
MMTSIILPKRSSNHGHGSAPSAMLGSRQPSASPAIVVGCRGNETLACMRKVPAGQLVEGMARTKMTAWPVVDNLTVPANRGAAWREARVAKGARVDEQHSPGRTGPGEPQYYDAALLRGPSPRATRRLRQRDAILSLYRSKPGLETDFDVAAAILTDSVWQCPQQILANVSASAGLSVWRSYINATVAELLPEKFRFLGRFHGSDLVLLFGSATFELTTRLYAFGNHLRGVIGRFVRNPHGGPGWPAVGSSYAPFDVAVLGDVGEQRSAGATRTRRTWTRTVPCFRHLKSKRVLSLRLLKVLRESSQLYFVCNL